MDLGQEHLLLTLVGALIRSLDDIVAVLGDHDLAEADLIGGTGWLVHLREHHVLVKNGQVDELVEYLDHLDPDLV